MRLKQCIFALVAMLLCAFSANAQESAVAKIGSTTYATFAEALTAASAMNGDVTVEVYDKVTLNTAFSGSYSSINFVGKDADAEIYLDVQGYITATGKKVSFTELTLSKSVGGHMTNAGFMNVAFGIYDVVEVAYTNCVFANGAYASSGNVTFNGCTFYRSHDKYGLWAYGNVDATVEGCTFADYRGIKMYAEGAAKTVDLTVKDTDFSAVNDKPAIVLTYGESVVLEGNTYSSTGTFELDLDGAPNGTAVTSDVAPTCKNDNGTCGVLVDGKIYTTVDQAAAVAAEGSNVTLLYSTNDAVEFDGGVNLTLANGVTADNVTVATSGVAKVGDTTYATLAEAVDAAQAGETVTLLADINLSEILVLDKAITLDGNDKTLTSTAGRAINVSGADGVTIKDLTINASGERAINVIQNATNVTIDNVTATAANYAVNVATSAPNAVVAIKGSNLTGLNVVNVASPKANVTINGGTITCNDQNDAEGYAALALNKDAAGAKIAATGVTFDIKGDSKKAKNGAEDGEITIDGSTDGVAVNVVYIKSESDYYYAYTSIEAAIEAAKAGETIVLIRDITASDIITINKAITLDLNDKKVTSTAKKAFEVHADATIKNGAIEAAQRCVDTRKAVELTLTDVELVATSTKYDNPQPLTIGGYDNGTQVTMENVEINAGTAGYGIITFVETELTATNSTIGGYNALYVKPGSDNSTFNFVDSDLSGSTVGNDVEGNSFSTIAVRANNVAVNVDDASTVTAKGNYSFAISFIGGSENTTTGSSVTVAGEITGNILDTPNGNTVNVKAEYADELAAAGYATVEAENGLVAVIKPVAQIGETKYNTLQAAVEAVKDGETVTVLEDITFTTGANGSTNGISYTRGASFTLDLNGKTITSDLGNNAFRFKIGDGNTVKDTEVTVLIKNGNIVSGSNNWCAISAATADNSGNKLILNLTDLTIEANKAGDFAVKSWAGAVVNAMNVDVTANYAGGFYAVGGEIVLDENSSVAQKGLHTAPYMSYAFGVSSGTGKMTINGGIYSAVPAATTDASNQGASHGSSVGGVMSSGGTLIINGGTFSNDNFGDAEPTAPRSLIMADAGAVVTINGGTFNAMAKIVDPTNNTGDASKNANVTIKGGTYSADPTDAPYNLVKLADGCVALPDLSGNYVVGVKPTATVNNLGMTTVAAGDYSIWNGSFDQNTEDDGDMPLSFVMQFLADQDAEAVAASPYANWYGDFVITFTGIEGGSFTADGCYLAGHYGSFGWVKVPVDGMLIEEGARYPVMLGVGMGQKYDYICSSVQDFKCALYLTPEILAANPDIQVKLELGVVDNSKGSDAAASALVNNENVYSVTDYTYEAEDFVVDPNYIAELTIDDANPVDYTSDLAGKKVGKLTYKRTFIAGIWNPMFVPFEVDIERLVNEFGLEVAYYNQMISDENENGGFDYKMEVKHLTSGVISHYPLFVKVATATEIEYVAEDVVLSSADEFVITTSSVTNTFKLYGTHQAKSVSDLNGKYAINASTGLWTPSSSGIKPHRLYFEIQENNNNPFASSPAKSIGIVVRGEDGTTGVEEITGENGEEMIFDLQGRRVLEPEKGGLYIINGKKVLVK